jgi:hypothetical protein
MQSSRSRTAHQKVFATILEDQHVKHAILGQLRVASEGLSRRASKVIYRVEAMSYVYPSDTTLQQKLGKKMRSSFHALSAVKVGGQNYGDPPAFSKAQGLAQ